MNKYKLVIFDLDGVLIDSIGVCEKAFRYSFEQAGGIGPAPFDSYRRHLGWRLPDIIEEMDLPQEMVKFFTDKSKELIDEITLFSEAHSTLRSLTESGVLIGIATGKSGFRAREILSSLGILQHFNLVVGSDEVVQAKPNPESLYKHLDYFNVKAKDVLYIGDAVSDIKAANSAEIDIAAAIWGDGDLESHSQHIPTFKIDCIADVLPLVGSKGGALNNYT